MVPALGASLLPSLSCPACWPAYASVLSAVGLSFLGQSRYLFWLNAAALVVSLAVLFRRARAGSYAPLMMGALAALLIMVGKFFLNSNPTTWLGAAGLLAAFVWGRSKSKLASCPACISSTFLEEEGNGSIKEG